MFLETLSGWTLFAEKLRSLNSCLPYRNTFITPAGSSNDCHEAKPFMTHRYRVLITVPGSRVKWGHVSSSVQWDACRGAMRHAHAKAEKRRHELSLRSLSLLE